jgi:hypothetical protein
MAMFMINYDLRAPGRNYAPLYSALGNFGAVRILESQFMVEMVATAKGLHALISQHLDQNDLLLVIQQFPNAQAAGSCLADGADWIGARMTT